MIQNAHILIVDDEPDIRDVLRLLLESKGHAVACAADGQSAIEYVNSNPDLDLILLDVMMPGMSGLDACAAIRGLCQAPILFLTAKTGESDQLDAYRSGGDDFLGKPFSQAVLLAKVESLLRRYGAYKETREAIQVSSLSLDAARRRVAKHGVPLELTEKEYNILAYLLSRRGSTVSAQEIYENVWGEKYLPASANTVMVHVLNLRKKVEDDASKPKLIRTVWGKGYQID